MVSLYHSKYKKGSKLLYSAMHKRSDTKKKQPKMSFCLRKQFKKWINTSRCSAFASSQVRESKTSCCSACANSQNKIEQDKLLFCLCKQSE